MAKSTQQFVMQLEKLNDPCTAGNRRLRWTSFNCGVATPDPDHWPICTGFRKGNWLLPESPGFGPYSPDTIWHGDADWTAMQYVSPGIWRGSVVSSSVRINGNADPIGTYLRYYEIVFTGDGVGAAILTAYTIEHPDPRFPATVAWSNTLPLAESSRLSLTTSTQFADAVEVQPFLNGGDPLPVSQGPHKPHGSPGFNPDGTYNSELHWDIFYEPDTVGQIDCFRPIQSMAANVTLCGTLTFSVQARVYTGPETYTIVTLVLSGEVGGTSSTADAYVGYAGNVYIEGGGWSSLIHVVSKSGEDYGWLPEVGAVWGYFTLSWLADCDGTDVELRIFDDAYVDVNPHPVYTLHTWTTLDHLTWWKSTHTFDWSLALWDDQIDEDYTQTVAVTLALHECGYYSYSGGGGEELPCLEQPIYVTFGESNDAAEFDAENPDYRTLDIPISFPGTSLTIHMELIRGSEPEPPNDTVHWTLIVNIYNEIAGSLACHETYDVTTYCIDGVLNGNNEIFICGLNLVIHAGE